MKFGIFYELQLPRPWQPDSELKLYQNALTQLELADHHGYDYAWVVEHHFLEEYSHSPAPEGFLAAPQVSAYAWLVEHHFLEEYPHSPAPEVFLGAPSQRTKHIRLGHGIIQLTTSHPARMCLVRSEEHTSELQSHSFI